MKKLLFLALVALCIQGHLSAALSLEKVPYAGLVLDKVDLEGVDISGFKFSNNKKFITVQPNQTVSCCLNYQTDADELKVMYRHHLVIGLYGDGPQDCAMSTFGIMDKKGQSTVKLTAPKKEGIYEVRASMGTGLSCEGAKKDWSTETKANTVLGFVTVQN